MKFFGMLALLKLVKVLIIVQLKVVQVLIITLLSLLYFCTSTFKKSILKEIYVLFWVKVSNVGCIQWPTDWAQMTTDLNH